MPTAQLTSHEVFSLLQPEQLDAISSAADEISLKAGDTVFRRGDTYTLSAQCTLDSRLLRIRASILKQLMGRDPVMGYAIQSLISRVYFKRYIDTMQKLQAVVQSIPLKTA